MQPSSAEDITIGLITVTVVVTLHCIIITAPHRGQVPVSPSCWQSCNIITYQLFNVNQSGVGVKEHGNTCGRDWNKKLHFGTRGLQHCSALAKRISEGQMAESWLEAQLGTFGYRLHGGLLATTPFPFHPWAVTQRHVWVATLVDNMGHTPCCSRGAAPVILGVEADCWETRGWNEIDTQCTSNEHSQFTSYNRSCAWTWMYAIMHLYASARGMEHTGVLQTIHKSEHIHMYVYECMWLCICERLSYEA